MEALLSIISALEGVTHCAGTTMRIITEMQGPETLQSIVTWSCTMRGKVAAKGERTLCSIGHHGVIRYISLYVVYTLGNWWFTTYTDTNLFSVIKSMTFTW